ncbi:MAG: hypothetical protein HYW98_01245 [Candidatus Wildermuthbacteria bacterium]|nr:hypothetical protein [Candidatus Wildermuthbacteria bacterium]
MSHTCKAVVVHCIDFRFCRALNDFFEEEYPEGYDNVVIAGGVKDIVEKGDQSFALGQLKLSMRLHQPKEIVLVQHEDCGAYGGSAALGEDELEHQKTQLASASAILKKEFPDAVLKTYLILLSQEIITV